MVKRTEKDIACNVARARAVKEREQRRKHFFPHCIGLFPECANYDKKADISERPECRLCPYAKKKQQGTF